MKTNTRSDRELFSRAPARLLLTAAAFCILSSSAVAQLYVSQDGTSGIVGKYDSNTGGAISANFVTGLNTPLDLALFGNDLFVADSANSRVGEYNATTGAAINANFITGLNGP